MIDSHGAPVTNILACVEYIMTCHTEPYYTTFHGYTSPVALDASQAAGKLDKLLQDAFGAEGAKLAQMDERYSSDTNPHSHVLYCLQPSVPQALSQEDRALHLARGEHLVRMLMSAVLW